MGGMLLTIAIVLAIYAAALWIGRDHQRTINRDVFPENDGEGQ